MGKCGVLLIVLGVIFLGLFSFLGFGGLNMLIEFDITMMMRLKEGSDIWHIWTTIPIPIYLKFRLFNITNPEEVETGAKAKLVEMGPYVYLEDLEKVDITIDEENDIIRYRQPRTYYFQPEMSNGTEADEVTFINIVYLSVVAAAFELSDDDFMLTSLDAMISEKGEKLTRTATVKELLFDGVSIQNFIDILNDDMVKAAAEASGNPVEIPENIADGKFALLKGLNGTSNEWFDVKSGKSGPSDVGKILKWQNKTALDFWRGTVEDGCNQINGTDSTIFPPFMTKESKVHAFSSQICRSLTFVYEQDTISENIRTYRFVASPDMFSSPALHAPNWCFCPKLRNETGSCERNGVFDLRSCMGGAPLLISFPHFYGADEWMVKAVEGLNPDPEKHKMTIDFHPLSGSPVMAFARLQFNIELIPYVSMPSFEEVRNAIIPFAWIEEVAKLDDANLNMLRFLDGFLNVFGFARFGLMGFGGLLIVVGIILLVVGRKATSAKVEGKEVKFIPSYD